MTEKELEQELIEISTRVERLRVHYQAYFLGMEKRPPLQLRDQLERLIRVTPLNESRKAVHKFRFQAAVQRYRIMAVYWDRIMRDLEEGRTTREKIRRDAGYHVRKTGADGALEPGLEVLLPPPPEDKDPMISLFRDFLEARKSVGMPIDGITEQAFRNSIEKQRAAQVEKLNVPDVTFSVAVRNGKVVLLARPVTSG